MTGLQCKELRRRGFGPCVKEIPWKRKWQPTLVFLSRKSHGQRSLVGYSPKGHRVGLDCAHTLAGTVYFSSCAFWWNPLWICHQMQGFLSISFCSVSLLAWLGLSLEGIHITSPTKQNFVICSYIPKRQIPTHKHLSKAEVTLPTKVQ